MRDVLEIHEFFVEGKNQDRSHVLLHITEPGTPEEMSKGYFFAVAEINNGSIEQIEHLQQMIDDLESGYYETEDQEGKSAFEITLEFINRRGHHVLQYHDAITNCLVGVLRGHELFFAYHGFPVAQLFYNNKEELSHLDILATPAGTQNPNQLFSSMLQGKISEGDYFYVATPHVADYFTADRITKILTSKNTRQSTEHIQKILSDFNDELSFGGILLHFPTEFQIPKTGKQLRNLSEKGSAESLNDMISQERNTAEILSPPIMDGIKKSWSNLFNKNNQLQKPEIKPAIIPKTHSSIEITSKGEIETNFRPRKEEESDTISNTILVNLGKGVVGAISMLYLLVKNIIVYSGKGLLGLFILITNKGGQREIVIKNFKQKIFLKQEALSNMTIANKLLLVFIILLMIIFIGSLFYFKLEKNNEIKKLAYQNQVQLILDKKTEADASLLYDDENKAFSLLQEAKIALNELPTDNKEEKTNASELQKEVDATLMKLRKLYTISPTILANLGSVEPTVQAQKIIKINQQLIAYGENDNNFYSINLSNNAITKKDHNNIPHLYSADTPKEQDKIIFLTGPNTVASFDPKTSLLAKIDILFPNEGINLANIFVYSQRLFTLDTVNNQIYKHNPTQTGYDKGTTWLKNTANNISDAASLAIDGDLFVLKKDGAILKYTSGLMQDFIITGLDPSLDNPSLLWTYNGVNNLYILEPTNKRVIVLDKNGKLIAQYTATEWQNPTGMVVDEAGGQIYILDTNKVYKFTLNK